MNFKLTKAKTIVSIIIGIFISFFTTRIIGSLQLVVILQLVITFLVSSSLVYVVWSLVQKVPTQ